MIWYRLNWQNGLLLDSVAITRLDQTPFHALDENNAFNAVDAPIRSYLHQQKRTRFADGLVPKCLWHKQQTQQAEIDISQEEEASISQQKAIETARASSMADIAEQQALSERRRDERIERAGSK